MKSGYRLRWLRACCLGALLALPLAAVGDDAAATIVVCYNYGCLAQASVSYSSAQLAEIGAMLGGASTASAERAQLAVAIGRLLGWAGEQSPIAADKGGNFADAGVDGRMDCIDHSITTTRLLRLLEARGMLHFHRVLEPALRRRFLIFEHHSAQIEESEPAADAAGNSAAAEAVGGARFVVDSWFYDNGHPAVVMPLSNWMAGEGPSVDE